MEGQKALTFFVHPIGYKYGPKRRGTINGHIFNSLVSLADPRTKCIERVLRRVDQIRMGFRASTVSGISCCHRFAAVRPLKRKGASKDFGSAALRLWYLEYHSLSNSRFEHRARMGPRSTRLCPHLPSHPDTFSSGFICGRYSGVRCMRLEDEGFGFADGLLFGKRAASDLVSLPRWFSEYRLEFAIEAYRPNDVMPTNATCNGTGPSSQPRPALCGKRSPRTCAASEGRGSAVNSPSEIPG
jgi:hypothetical protein